MESKVEKIVDSNVEKIPYEGDEVNRYGIKRDFLKLIKEILKDHNIKLWSFFYI